MFDVLTYQKGAAVLRMLEQYLGPEPFREGIRRYLDAAPLRQHRDDRPVGRHRGGVGRAGPGRSWTPGSSRAAIRWSRSSPARRAGPIRFAASASCTTAGSGPDGANAGRCRSTCASRSTAPCSDSGCSLDRAVSPVDLRRPGRLGGRQRRRLGFLPGPLRPGLAAPADRRDRRRVRPARTPGPGDRHLGAVVAGADHSGRLDAVVETLSSARRTPDVGRPRRRPRADRSDRRRRAATALLCSLRAAGRRSAWARLGWGPAPRRHRNAGSSGSAWLPRSGCSARTPQVRGGAAGGLTAFLRPRRAGPGPADPGRERGGRAQAVEEG